MGERPLIVVAGGVGAMPFAGVAWQVLHYLEGFRRLGHDVFYLEDTQRWPYDPLNETVCDDAGPAIEYVRALMARHGFRWAYRDVVSGQVCGMSERALAEVLAAADVLVNLSGVMVLREEHLQIPVRVYLETDPVRPQIEIAQGRRFTIDFLAAHTHHFTYGENFGAPDCGVPVERFEYQPTRPPVILDWWVTRRGAGPRPFPDGVNPRHMASTHPPAQSAAFTTVANWRQTSKDIAWKGQMLTWSKDVQFLHFLSLPSRVRAPIELALAAGESDALRRLRSAGWRVRAAGPLSKDIDAYRAYVCSSAGEFSVAKEQNVALRSGWLSDRTACYLAAGRPAIVQDTAFGRAVPTGEGLLAFSTLEEAIQAFERVLSGYQRHCRAARSIAEEYLSADVVLGDIMRRLSRVPTVGPLSQ